MVKITRAEYALARSGTSVVVAGEAALALAVHQARAKVDWNAWLSGDECHLKNGYTVTQRGAVGILRWRG